MMSGIEIWKDIPDYEGIYQVSNSGKVRSLNRWVGTHNPNPFAKIRLRKYIHKGRVLKARVKKDKYVDISLCKDGKKKTLLLHRLVMLAFKGPMPKDKEQVNHIDHDRQNNKLENLEYVTRKENFYHMINAGRSTFLDPEVRRLGSAKIKEESVVKIREMKKNKIPIREIGRRYGISHTQVCRICRKENWGNT